MNKISNTSEVESFTYYYKFDVNIIIKLIIFIDNGERRVERISE